MHMSVMGNIEKDTIQRQGKGNILFPHIFRYTDIQFIFNYDCG